jgi:monomeric isocitrate dehydrogenase
LFPPFKFPLLFFLLFSFSAAWEASNQELYIGGYFHVDAPKTDKVMRCVPTLNDIITKYSS